MAGAKAKTASKLSNGAHTQTRLLLGQILVDAGIITAEHLERALEQQKATGERLGRILLSMGAASQEGIASALSQKLGIKFTHLHDVLLDEETLKRVPEHLARRHQVIPIGIEDGSLVLGMVDPLDILAIDDIRTFSGMKIQSAIITLEDFQRALNQYPATASTADEVIQQITPDSAVDDDSVERMRVVADEAPVVRLASLIIGQAIRQSASDIHVEPQDRRVRIRYRIDGALYSVMTPPKHVHAALVSRLKIMANLNIAERRLPQDGRMELKYDNREVDLRVSTIPTAWGESVVMRILDKSNGFVDIEKLGLASEDRATLEGIIGRPHGIILNTGPTGSGKTTSLYAMLNRLNRTEVKIVTIEDPVEYQLPGVNQVSINPKAGLTFSSGLRAFLRQDPDIIMVGEVRDDETARIATQAALTGHLVLSSLHTNDAAGAVIRLVKMGIEPFLVASSVIAIFAQRLVRVLCPHCKEPYTPAKEVLERVGLSKMNGNLTFYRAIGCPHCHQIGYRGRTGIYEILTLNENLRNVIARNATSGQIKEAAVAAGMRTLQRNGLAKVMDGTTSLEEVFRVVFVED